MNTSSLRFLDYDMCLMLTEQVRISQGEEARKFHSNNFENSHELHLNQRRHYLISKVFDEMKNYVEYLSGDGVYINNQISVQIYKEWYEDVLREYNENTKLQRCGYQSMN